MNILSIVCSIKHWKSQCGKMQTQICCFYYVNIRLKCHNFALIQNISSLLWYDNTSFSKYLLSSFLFFWTYQKTFFISRLGASWRPRGSQSGRDKRWDKAFQVRAKEPLGTESHRAIFKHSSGCPLLIGHKKCFVLLCPIGELFLLSSFCKFIGDCSNRIAADNYRNQRSFSR